MKPGDLVKFKTECAWEGRFTGVVAGWPFAPTVAAKSTSGHVRIHWINPDGTISHRTEKAVQLEVISESR